MQQQVVESAGLMGPMEQAVEESGPSCLSKTIVLREQRIFRWIILAGRRKNGAQVKVGGNPAEIMKPGISVHVAGKGLTGWRFAVRLKAHRREEAIKAL